MRADRLISLLMLLQTRGRMKAHEVASELEVSERTVYRDIDALSAAGIPVYGEPGPHGGFALVDNYRTNLTGLTEGEARALFMLSIPESLFKLGIGQELGSALLKLSAALPSSRRYDEKWVRQRFHLDTTWWKQDGEKETEPLLHTIHQAVRHDRMVHLTYRRGIGTEITQLVAPFGLVAKAGSWYLVCGRQGSIDVHKVSSIIDTRMTNDPFERPDDFDLVTFWQIWCTSYQENRFSYTVTVRVAPHFLHVLPRCFGERIRDQMVQNQPDAEGWVRLKLSFESLEAARERILTLGRGVEVVEPRALRRSVLDYAEQIVALYAH